MTLWREYRDYPILPSHLLWQTCKSGNDAFYNSAVIPWVSIQSAKPDPVI